MVFLIVDLIQLMKLIVPNYAILRTVENLQMYIVYLTAGQMHACVIRCTFNAMVVVVSRFPICAMVCLIAKMAQMRRVVFTNNLIRMSRLYKVLELSVNLLCLLLCLEEFTLLVAVIQIGCLVVNTLDPNVFTEVRCACMT